MPLHLAQQCHRRCKRRSANDLCRNCVLLFIGFVWLIPAICTRICTPRHLLGNLDMSPRFQAVKLMGDQTEITTTAEGKLHVDMLSKKRVVWFVSVQLTRLAIACLLGAGSSFLAVRFCSSFLRRLAIRKCDFSTSHELHIFVFGSSFLASTTRSSRRLAALSSSNSLET